MCFSFFLTRSPLSPPKSLLHTQPPAAVVLRFQRARRLTRLREGEVSGQFPDATFPAHLLEFHSAVLKPNLDLPVSEVYALTDL